MIDDILAIGFLVFLEGVLSIDNALVLALLVRKLPHDSQKKALTYGLVGAVAFRLAAILLAAYLMQWTWVKFLGGAYLIYLPLHHWWKKSRGSAEGTPEVAAKMASFWRTVMIVELTDIAFAIDSILTAVAVTKKIWVVMVGGFLGLVMMRFAASLFIKLLEKFPRFEPTAYVLVLVIGAKLVLEGLHLPGVDFHDSESPAFWAFWILMAATLAFGFTKKNKNLKA